MRCGLHLTYLIQHDMASMASIIEALKRPHVCQSHKSANVQHGFAMYCTQHRLQVDRTSTNPPCDDDSLTYWIALPTTRAVPQYFLAPSAMPNRRSPGPAHQRHPTDCALWHVHVRGNALQGSLYHLHTSALFTSSNEEHEAIIELPILCFNVKINVNVNVKSPIPFPKTRNMRNSQDCALSLLVRSPCMHLWNNCDSLPQG